MSVERVLPHPDSLKAEPALDFETQAVRIGEDRIVINLGPQHRRHTASSGSS